MTPITMNWPHSYAVVLQNPGATQLIVPWLGRRGITFRPGEVVAVVGNCLTAPNDPKQYNGKRSITGLAELVATGQLNVLSIPGSPNEKNNTDVPVIDAQGQPLPNCRIEF